MELQGVVGSLTRFRRVNTWVHIEALVDNWVPRRLGQVYFPRAKSGSFSPTSFYSPSSCSSTSDESGEDTDTEMRDSECEFDEVRPFPCSHPTCRTFHDLEGGYCQRHRCSGFCRRICSSLNSQRRYCQLVVLMFTQAIAEAESRHLLFLVVFSLFPVACYSLSQLMRADATAMLLSFAVIAVMSTWYTTVRLNRMQELSRELEVRAESIYARHLGSDLSTLFGDQGEEHITQFRVNSLQEHYLEARRHAETFHEMVCLPLKAFLDSKMVFGLSENLRPKLMPVPLAREALEREGDPSRVFDILYCNVTLPDLTSIARAWQFLKTCLENDEGNVQIMSMRDSFALAQAGHRCAEIVVRVHSYLATIRFFEDSLNELEEELDDVHRRARQLGLVASKEACRRQPASKSRPWFLDVSLGILRTISLLAAVYLAGQYFARYSPKGFQSEVRHSPVWPAWQYVFALESDADPSAHPETWVPCLFFTLPYLVLTFVLVCDLQRCQAGASTRSLTPIQLLYESDFGIHGRFYNLKVAVSQFFIVMLQALGKIPVMGGFASFALQEDSDISESFTLSFWIFVAILCINSLYPSILFLFPSNKWARLGVGILDAILDIAYTLPYLVVTLLASYVLVMKRVVSGNFGVEEVELRLKERSDPQIAFPTNFFGYFAVYYSVAHVCMVCRALERNVPKAWLIGEGSSSLPSLCPKGAASGGKCEALCKVLPPGCRARALLASFFCSSSLSIPFVSSSCHAVFACVPLLIDVFALLLRLRRYSPSLLLVVAYLVLSSSSYPNHRRVEGCFPCDCKQVGGIKQLSHCHVAGALHIKDVYLNDQNISSIAPHAFRFLPGLQRLSLSGNPLQVLPAKLFAPLKDLELLDLSRADLRHVSAKSFAGLSALKVLSLSGNELKHLPEGLLYPMPSLEKLLLGDTGGVAGLEAIPKVVAGNELLSLPPDVFKRSLRLRVLDLSDNRLATLPEGLFSMNGMLESLDLARNRLTDLPVDIFKGLSRLQKLELLKNKLSKVPLGLFSDLGHLEMLDMRYNQVRELAAGAFTGLASLKRLDMQCNPLRELPVGSFAGLPNLECLVLSQGSPIALAVGLFAGLPNLKALMLTGKSISELSAGIFAGLGHLEALHLSRNPLGKLPVGIFDGLGRLEQLYLSNTSLTELSPSSLAGLSNLKHLVLSKNLLTEVPVEALTGLPSLTGLELGDNSISKLPVGVFTGMGHLESLSLDRNPLSKLPSGVFAGLGRLKSLRLAQTSLSELNPSHFLNLGNLQTLSLRKNSFAELPVGVLASLPSLRKLDLAYNRISELPIGGFAALSNLTVLNLMHNLLRELPVGAFAGLGHLQSLYLQQNPLRQLPDEAFAGLNCIDVLLLYGTYADEPAICSRPTVHCSKARFPRFPNLPSKCALRDEMWEGCHVMLSGLRKA